MSEIVASLIFMSFYVHELYTSEIRAHFILLVSCLQFRFILETRSRVLYGELYTQGLQNLIYLCLSTDCFMKILSPLIRT